MEAKKKLKLEVKTLEARIAPGSCYNMHMQSSAGRGVSAADAQTEWNAYENKLVKNGMQPAGENQGAAGVPVIGIN